MVSLLLGEEMDVEVDEEWIHHLCHFSPSGAGTLCTKLHQPLQEKEQLLVFVHTKTSISLFKAVHYLTGLSARSSPVG